MMHDELLYSKFGSEGDQGLRAQASEECRSLGLPLSIVRHIIHKLHDMGTLFYHKSTTSATIIR